MKKIIYSIFSMMILFLQSFSAMALDEKEITLFINNQYAQIMIPRAQIMIPNEAFYLNYKIGTWENIIAATESVATYIEGLKKSTIREGVKLTNINGFIKPLDYKCFACTGKTFKSNYEATTIFELKDCNEVSTTDVNHKDSLSLLAELNRM